jgi:hypothetical protein
MCAPGPPAPPWAEVQAKADALIGKPIRVRGPLGIGLLEPNDGWSRKRCSENECCQTHTLPLVIAGTFHDLALDTRSFHCSGDESRRCCNAAARGQTVIAEGVLQGFSNNWELRQATLCVPASRP